MSSKSSTCQPYFWMTIFAIAMGFLEASVVVYLRMLLYPHGFAFPLIPIPQSLAVTEILREAATLVMLIGAGILAGRSFATRFAWFLYAFAIWDIFYYVFLRLLLNWPESLMTWDVLFLIPVTWVGPVITPVIVSFTMILLTVLIIKFDAQSTEVKLNAKEWFFLVSGSLILILAFIWDYTAFMLEHYSFGAVLAVSTHDLMKLSYQYIPRTFHWGLFCLAEIIILAGIGMFWKRNRK